MKKYAIPILKSIVSGILDVHSEKKLFSIKCLKCESIRELEDGFYKSRGNIEVENPDENSIYAGENIVSIRCDKCGNKIFSSDF